LVALTARAVILYIEDFARRRRSISVLDDEIRWKEQLHAQWTTPDEVINHLVLSASGSAVGTRSRISPWR
jgi:hypothetical protein